MHLTKLICHLVLLLAFLSIPAEAQTQSDLVQTRIKWEEAKIAVKAGNYSTALRLYEELITDIGRLPQLFFEAAQAAFGSGNNRKARQYVNEALSSDDENFKNSSQYREAIRLAAQINTASREDAAAIKQAIYGDDISKLRQLFRSGADPNALDDRGDLVIHTALQIQALESNQFEYVTVFLQNGFDPNARDSEGRSILSNWLGHCRIEENRKNFSRCLEIAELLVKAGADVNGGTTGLIRIPFSYYSSESREKSLAIIRFLLDRGADPDKPPGSDRNPPLHGAASGGDMETAKLLIKSGADLNARDERGSTPLHQAIREKNLEMIKLLLRSGADIDARSEYRGTALHIAMFHDIELIRHLLESGADVNAKDNFWGSSPLHSVGASTEKLRLLLRYGAEIDTKNNSGRTPLHLAAAAGRTEVVRHMIQAGANLDTEPTNHSALEQAAMEGHPEIVDVLREAGGEVTVFASAALGDEERVQKLTGEGPTPAQEGAEALVGAAGGGQVQIVRMMINVGTDVNSKSRADRFALIEAVTRNRVEVVRLLVQSRADLEVSDENGTTPVGFAAMHLRELENSDPEVLRILVEAGADVNRKNKDGFLPMHAAVVSKHIEGVELLIKAGADVNVEDPVGVTPLQRAEGYEGDPKIVQLLKKAGARR